MDEAGVGSASTRNPQRSARVGAILWLLALQFFIVQVIVARQWATPYSLSFNVISDLGNTACGPYPTHSTNVVCSPWHALMNVSFVVLGITMTGGALLTVPLFAGGLRRASAVVLFVLGGMGVAVVGLYPENESTVLHASGAAANFVGASIALILYGTATAKRGPHSVFMVFSVVAGMTGLAGTLLLVAGIDVGLGDGGIERVAAYPVSVWQIVAGLHLIRSPILGTGGYP